MTDIKSRDWSTISPNELIEFVVNNPKLPYSQMCKIWGVSRGAIAGKVSRASDRNGIAKMKTRNKPGPPKLAKTVKAVARPPSGGRFKRMDNFARSYIAKGESIPPTPIVPNKVTEPAPKNQSKTLLDLGDRECRFIVEDNPARYCAAPVTGSFRNSYCTYHKKKLVQQ